MCKIKYIRLLSLFFLLYIFFLMVSKSNYTNYSYFISIIIPSLIIFLPKAKMRNWVDDRYIRIVFLFLLSGVPYLFGLELIHESESIKYPPSENYIFRISGSSSGFDVSYFELYFDFESSKGNIRFNTNTEDLNRLNHLKIILPDNLNITNIVIDGGRPTDKMIQYDYSISDYISETRWGNGTRDGVYFNRFNFSEEYDIWFVIDFEGQIIPRGNYGLMIDARNVLEFSSEWIVFDLDPYSCNSNCWTEIYNANIIMDDNRLIITPNKDYYEYIDYSLGQRGSFHQEFYLNMFNKNQERTKSFFNSFGIAILASSMILFLEGMMLLLIYFIDMQIKTDKQNKKPNRSTLRGINLQKNKNNPVTSNRVLNPERNKTYLCKKCDKNHRYISNLGKEHLIHKFPQ